jgi:hypothetical protein
LTSGRPPAVVSFGGEKTSEIDPRWRIVGLSTIVVGSSKTNGPKKLL